MAWHFCVYARCKSHSERTYLGFPSGKSSNWGTALSNAIWLGESCWVQLKCFTWKIQILFTESEIVPQTAGPLAQFYSQVLQIEQDRWTVWVPDSHYSPVPGSFCHGLDFWYGQCLMLGWPLSAPTSLCIQFLQISDPQKVVLLFVVPYLLTDSCLSNLRRKRQKISYILE